MVGELVQLALQAALELGKTKRGSKQGTGGTWFAFWKGHLTLPAGVREGTAAPGGPGREAGTLGELGAGVPLRRGGTWCRWREARVNGDRGGCGEVSEALIVRVSDVLLQRLKKMCFTLK